MRKFWLRCSKASQTPFPNMDDTVFCSHLASISAVQVFLDRYPVDEDIWGRQY